MKWLILMGLSVIGAVCYRMGGSDSWDTKVRDLGVPVCMVLAMWALGYLHWSLFFCFGLLFGSLTTYWKKKDSDAKWWNWLLVGLGFSLAMIPLVICFSLWQGFVIRTLVLTLATMIWSISNGNAVQEELGRGFLIIATLPLLTVSF